MTKKTIIDTSTLSLVVYQNEPFIDGLYQATYEGMTEEATSEQSDKKAESANAKVGIGTKSILPIKASAEAGGKTSNDSGQVFTQKMTYSNAYRLHKVRQELYLQNSIKHLKSKSDADSVVYGDFIEFNASFENNEFSQLLDLVTPELGGIFGYMYYMSELEKDQNATFQEHVSNGRAALGRSIVEALHKEFRNETSAEFYGKIENVDASAVVICDKQFFTNGDSDRLLDGTFTVFGKVVAINKTGNGFSKFERNKILKRIKPAGLKWVQNKVKEMGSVEDYLDTNLELTIDGLAFKVIPVAIYV